MKKVVFAALVLLLIVSASFAQIDRYQIVSEKKGLLGMGAKMIIMLDKETGDSWVYNNDKWQALPKIMPEDVEAKMTAEREAKEKLASDLQALKAKQTAEIQDLNKKHEAEIQDLSEKLAGKNIESSRTVARPNSGLKRTVKRTAPRVAAAGKKAASSSDNQVNEEAETPAWLSE